MTRVLIFDTETTKLIKNSLRPLKMQPKIVEFCGFVANRDGEVKKELDFLCHPGEKIGEETTKITGITNEMVKGLSGFDHFSDQVIETIETVDVCVAHNLAYDKAVVDFELKRIGKSVRWPEMICTVEATEHIKGYRMSLMDLHEYLFEEKFEAAHRARTDVTALTKCYAELVKRSILD